MMEAFSAHTVIAEIRPGTDGATLPGHDGLYRPARFLTEDQILA